MRDLAVLLAVVLAVGVAAMPAEQYKGDPLAMRMATWSLLEEGRLDVDPELARQAGERGQYFYERGDGRWFSKYGVLNSLAYAPAMLVQKALEGKLEPIDSGPRRTLLLNLHNLLLSLGIAWLLYHLAGLYTEEAWLRGFFVLSSLYATFLWNYLRAQSSEILQVLLYLGVFHLLIRYLRSGRGLLGAAGWWFLLCLTKSVYLLLIPVLALAAWWRRARPVAWLPLAGVVAALLCIHAYKFGSPFATGYTQWTREADLFSGNLREGLTGFLFHPQRSVFLHYPLLIPALAGLFSARRRREAALAWGALGILWLFYGQTKNWAGHWSYGPRYLLPSLVVASLSALEVLRRPPWLAGSGVLLLASAWLQFQVNSLPFFTFYEVQARYAAVGSPEIDAYFRRVPFGWLHYTLRTYRRTRRPPPFMQRARERLSREEYAALVAITDAAVVSNYYWSRR